MEKRRHPPGYRDERAALLRAPVVTGAIVGARSAGQVEGFIGAGDCRLTADEVKELEDFVRGARLPHGEQHA